VPGTQFEKASLETIIKNADGAIFNNGAQIWNHTFYFESFSRNGKKMPDGHLAEAINKSFGSFETFREQFTKAASTLFGAGWAWLVKNPDGSLRIVQESNAGNPLKSGLKPLLTCDVWEHAYYIDYRNRRPDYIKSFWEIIDWNVISNRF
jgi:Fe-Mn family superoxide dismutase